MRKHPLAVRLTLALGTGLGLGSPGLMAQTADAPRFALEEVIVTATRRETNLQQTSVTIQAVGEQDLVNIGATNLNDIVGLVPGLIITGEDLTIRGVRSSLEDRSGTVGTTSRYLDETPIEHNFRIFDVARVEVLKGPQGTLYGAGAMGGTIRMVTNKPDASAFSANIDVDYSATDDSDDDNYEINGMINVPLVENTLALRAVAYQHDYAGFIDDIGILGIDDYNEEEVTGGRVALRWDASDTVAITGTYIYEDVETSGLPLAQLALGDLQTDRFYDTYADGTWDVANILIDWDLDWASMTFTATHTENDVDEELDSTRFINGALGLPDPPNGGFLNAYQIDDGTNETDVAELRLVSKLDGKWEWVVGAFYQDRDSETNTSIFVTEVDPDNPSLGVRVGDPDGFDNRDQLLDQRILESGEEEWAAFGELTYNFTEQWSVTGGIRYLDIEQTEQAYVLSTWFGFPAGLGDPLPEINVSHSDYYTKAKVAYQANDDLLLYFLRSEGFRRGGFNGTATLGEALGVPNVPTAFDSDEVENWELGLKSEWMNNRLMLNAALYYIDWTDIRVGALHPSGLNFTTNGPAADIYGLELEFTYLVNESLTLNATAAFTDTELSGEEVDPVLEAMGVPYPDNLTLAPEGEELPGVPDQTYSLTANYLAPGLVGSFDGYARFDVQYTSSSYNTYKEGQFSAGRVEMDAYTIANLRMGVNNSDGWDIAVYANNLTDETADLFIDVGGFDPQSARRNRPRTIGLNIRKAFN